MDWFWNEGEKEIIGGLDILGLRQLDQNIERELVSGITTISSRARYLTLLPWVIALYYESKETPEGVIEIDPDELEKVLARLEFITLAATVYGSKNDELGDTTGMIGLDKHYKPLESLFENGEVAVPDEKPGGALNTYMQPCRSFGIMDNDSTGIKILPRGTEIFKARQAKVSDASVTNILLAGGVLKSSQLETCYQYFSVNGFSSIPEEKDLLKNAMFSSFSDNEPEHSRYKKFRETSKWALFQIQIAGITSAKKLIQDNFRRLSLEDSQEINIELAWFDYEIHRRVHFALESILGAFTDVMRSFDGGGFDFLINELQRDYEIPLILKEAADLDGFEYTENMSKWISRIPTDMFLNSMPSSSMINKFSLSSRLLFSLCLLTACWKQSKNQKLSDREHVMENVFDMFEDEPTSSITSLVKKLMEECVIKPHISNTLRKMQNGQQCSLRFYPEGNIYRPTGMGVYAGFSNDRLSNLIGIFRDVGLIHKSPDSLFSLTDDGSNLLNELTA